VVSIASADYDIFVIKSSLFKSEKMKHYNPNNSAELIDVLLLSSSDDEYMPPPIHSHDKGELLMPLTGSIMSEVWGDIWMVPPESAVWIPAGTPHTSKPVSMATFCLLFVDSKKLKLPDKCFTMSISPLIKEMIIYLTGLSDEELAAKQATMLIDILMDMIPKMPREKLNFPLPSDQGLKTIADLLLKNPADRRTVKQWAYFLSMSERTFSRLVTKEVGMTFGLWRRQLHIVVSLQLLTEGKSVQLISEYLGYDSVSAFITMFKKALGKSPRQYIKSTVA